MLMLSYSERDITPGKQVDLCGFTLRKGKSSGTSDPLKMRWMGLSDGSGGKALLGSADLISLSRQGYRSLREGVCASGVIRSSEVALATTHTHSGPATVRLRHCGKMDRAYLSDMKDAIIASGDEAAARIGRAVRVVWGSGSCKVAINRRSGDAGSIDREVTVVGFLCATTGAPLATAVNFACHPVVLGHNSNAVSADYPGYLTSYMEAQTGAPCLFFNGACGDVNPRNDKSVDPEAAALTGRAVAKVALDALSKSVAVENDLLQWHHCSVKIPVRVPSSAQDFERRLDMLEKQFAISRSLFSDRVASDTRLLAEGRYPKSVTLELSLLTIGKELGFLFVPGEVFSSIGLRIKQMGLPRKLIISGFSNGSVGYLPDRQAYLDGGYEPYYANFFYDFPEFDPSVEEIIIEGAERLLKSAGQSNL